MSYGICAFATDPYAGECLEIGEDPAPDREDNVEEFCVFVCTSVGI